MPETKLLLVDDEDSFLIPMQKRLAKRGIKTLVVFSGEEALKKLAEVTDIDVVILDIMMPGMDGIETLKEIKRKFPSMEVILLTGNATFDSAIQGMRFGAFDYLMKPCDLEELLSKVEEAKSKKNRYAEKVLLAAQGKHKNAESENDSYCH